jgi:D-xylose transport system permease protein
VDSLKKEQSLGEILRFQLKNNIRQYAMFFVLIGIWLILTIATGGVFIQGRNLTNLLLQSSFIAVLAVGMVLVIVAGHIDLSVGSIAGFIGAVAAILNVYLGWNTIFVVVVALALGIVIGLWQGYWIAYQGIPAFIVTLAGMTIFRGLLLAVGRGETIAPISESFAALGGGYLPRLFINVGERNGFHDLTAILVVLLIIAFIVMQLRTRQKRVEYGFSVLPINVEILKIVGGSLLIGVFFIPLMTYRGIPYSILILMSLVLFYTFLTNNTVFGRHVYALGGNKEAARLSGINIRRKTLMIFVSMGFLSAVSGLIFTARLKSATASAGNLFELDTIAATIIGGTSTLGGEGTVFGAIVGALLMSSITNGMQILDVPSEWQMVVRGLVLLLAVWYDVSMRKKQ